MRMLVLTCCALALSGCIVNTVAKTAVGVATLPFKVAGAAVDAATTSQDEADRNAGRKLRKEEERQGKERRLAEKRCRSGKQLPTDDCAAILRH